MKIDKYDKIMRYLPVFLFTVKLKTFENKSVPHKLRMKSGAVFFAFLLMTASLSVTTAGPLAYGICQTGCNAVVVACYAGAGFTFGTG